MVKGKEKPLQNPRKMIDITGGNKIDTRPTKNFELCSGDKTLRKKKKFHRPRGKTAVPMIITIKLSQPPTNIATVKTRNICRIKLIIKQRKNFKIYNGKENFFI